jgi:D-alanyl-D-alanine carboxypeptidase
MKLSTGAALTGIVALILTACGSSHAEPPSLDDTLRPLVTSLMAKMKIPGLIVAVQTADRGSWQAALGVSDVATHTPMDLADHVRIGSITKSMTATVVLQLAQEGRLSLDDPLAPYFPEIDTNNATIRQALQLTSGVADYTTTEFLNSTAADPQRVWSPEELVATVAGQPPMFPAGEGWYYSNTNFVMLGIIAERVTGQSLAQLIADRIFGPLGMTGCSYPAAADASIPWPSARGYMFGLDWGRAASPPAPLPPLVDVADFNPSWAAGAGAAICTAADMSIWGRALAAGELLAPEMQAERLAWVPAGDPNAKYGLGVVNIKGLVGHNGEISGYMSQTARRESDGTVIVVLSNVMMAPDLTEPATAISELISEAIPARS